MDRFLRFSYAAIKRHGDKTWTAHTGLIEFNTVYTISCSACERGDFGDAHDRPYIIELSNGTKFLCFINDVCGPDDDLLSEKGEMGNKYAQRVHHKKVRQNITSLNNTY